ncbi:MAG: TetR/AcrR family transcriptional regulator [Myxococcota bacterium]
MVRSAERLEGAGGVSADGRARRRERSRDAIVNALHALIGEGVVQPTAQQVAERASVGLRSVFRHFADMDSLYAEVGARVQDAALPLLRDPPSSGSVEARALEMVEHRSAFFEEIAHYKRAGNLARRRSVYLQRQHSRLVRDLRERLLRGLPELARAPEILTESLDLVLSFDAWDRLRVDQKLSRERATAALRGAVRALLAELPRSSAARPRGRTR